MGFGGGGTPDMPAPAPKAEVTKPVTEAATAAATRRKNEPTRPRA